MHYAFKIMIGARPIAYIAIADILAFFNDHHQRLYLNMANVE